MKLTKMTKTILMVAAVCLELAAFACVILSHLEEVTQIISGIQKKLSSCCLCKGDDSLETYDDEFEDWDV